MRMIRLFSLLETDIEAHLRSRGVDPSRTNVIMDKESGKATFLLYNLSGQLVGYQQYNPSGDKKGQNRMPAEHRKALAKYYNYVTKEDEHTSKIAVWGLETVFEHSRQYSTDILQSPLDPASSSAVSVTK